MKKTQKQLNTSPRGYLSWSQMALFEKDKNLYYQVYWEGVQQFMSKYLLLGKRMADTLEFGFDPEHDATFEGIVLSLPPYPEREFEIKEELDGITLLGRMDGFDEGVLDVGEYKSGKKWTQKLVDNHGQLTFYALLVWLKYKKLPSKIKLHWAQTKDTEDGGLELTGYTQTFETVRTMADIILFTKRIKDDWRGICAIGKFMKKV